MILGTLPSAYSGDGLSLPSTVTRTAIMRAPICSQLAVSAARRAWSAIMGIEVMVDPLHPPIEEER
jgi:hypothetical protein